MPAILKNVTLTRGPRDPGSVGKITTDIQKRCPKCAEEGVTNLLSLIKATIDGASWIIGWCSRHQGETYQERIV